MSSLSEEKVKICLKKKKQPRAQTLRYFRIKSRNNKTLKHM